MELLNYRSWCITNRIQLIALLAVFWATQCGRMPPAPWPWWTSTDSASVRQEIDGWSDFLSLVGAWGDSLYTDFKAGLNYSDSSSRNGDTIYKIAHLRRFWVDLGAHVRRDIYQFGVTVDTISMGDTFCQVIYRDSFGASVLTLEFDTLWVIAFRPDTIIDTTRTPPETTVVYRVSSVEKRGFSTPSQAVKSFAWLTTRWLFLRRVRQTNNFKYTLTKISGAYALIPSAEDAPQISRVILSKPGRVDTIYFSPRSDGRGLTNLKSLESLYLIRAGEEIGVTISTTTPQDTVADRNRFFITTGGRSRDVTIGPRTGQGTVRFTSTDTGYQHIFIEVLPVSNILYPNSNFTATIWAIPVLVVRE